MFINPTASFDLSDTFTDSFIAYLAVLSETDKSLYDIFNIG